LLIKFNHLPIYQFSNTCTHLLDEKIKNDSSYKVLRQDVNISLHAQLVDMFQNIHSSNTVIDEIELKKLRLKNIKPEKKKLSDLIGFELEVKPSTVVNSGDGVFVKEGSILPGQIIALFPGHVHLAEYTKKKEHIESLLPDDNFMLMVRKDGIIVDSRQLIHNKNPYAVAHKVNHPPAGVVPNSLQLPFNFSNDPLDLSDDIFPHEIRHLIPNKYSKEPSFLGSPDRSAFMHTMVLLSTKHISVGDEIFMDYRLKVDENGAPNTSLPTWYTPTSLNKPEMKDDE
jgi:hypothetical protein